MKRIISLLLVGVMVLALCSCSSSGVKDVEALINAIDSSDDVVSAVAQAEEAYNALPDNQKSSVSNYDALKNAMRFSLARQAFDNIDGAFAIVDNYGSDIYEAWYQGIHNKDCSFDDLVRELSLSKDDCIKGIAYLFFGGEDSEYDFPSMTVADVEEECGITASDFSTLKYLFDNEFSAFVNMVSAAYKANGTVFEAQTMIDEATEQMKEMSNKYSDYEHYTNLKGYYTTTNAFLEFCKSPTGSFNQVQDTINTYRNDARSYRNDIAYIFD